LWVSDCACGFSRWLCLLGLSLSVSLRFSLLPFLLCLSLVSFSSFLSGFSYRYSFWILFSTFAGSFWFTLFLAMFSWAFFAWV
jgi:hypothetical protein